MTAQEVTIDELWALARQHANSLNRESSDYLPTIDEEKKIWVEGKEVFFHIDNEPAIYYRVENTEDLVYFDCDELYKLDKFDGVNNNEIMSTKEELMQRIREVAKGTRDL